MNIEKEYPNLEKDIFEKKEEYNKEAENIIKDNEEVENMLIKLSKKLEIVPGLGKILSNVPILIDLVRAYIRKEYTNLPLGTIISIVGGLIYVLSPIDAIPDLLPMVGYLDDATVIAGIINLVGNDIAEYKAWLDSKNPVEKAEVIEVTEVDE